MTILLLERHSTRWVNSLFQCLLQKCLKKICIAIGEDTYSNSRLTGKGLSQQICSLDKYAWQGLHIFPGEIAMSEIKHYITYQTIYDLMQDIYRMSCKYNRLIRITSSTKMLKHFTKMLQPLVYRYANHTSFHLLVLDWYENIIGKSVSFPADLALCTQT